MSKYNVGLKTLLQEGHVEPDFFGDNLFYGVCMSYLIRFNRASSQVSAFNNRNKILTA